MGIPYSRQINDAFNQVTPLVAEGFRVLETTKNIAIVLAFIEVLTAILLAFILLALVALLITTNPDFADERQTYVTPTLKTVLRQGAFVAWTVGGVVLLTAMIGGLYFAIYGGSVSFESSSNETDENKESGDKE
jgi:hypothetical protein